MANNYDIIIRSEKVNQYVASEIFNFISKNHLIHNFKYLDRYEIKCYIRGYVDLREILTNHGFDETDFTEIMDEFNRAYRHMVSLDADGNPLPDDHPERIKEKEMADEIETEVAAGKFTIWAVGEETDKWEEEYEREQEANKNLPKSVQSAGSFFF